MRELPKKSLLLIICKYFLPVFCTSKRGREESDRTRRCWKGMTGGEVLGEDGMNWNRLEDTGSTWNVMGKAGR